MIRPLLNHARISNPGTWTSNFTIKLYNSSGTQVGNTYSNSVANGTSRQVDGTALGVSNATYTVRIASDYPLVAAYMTKTGAGHYGGTAQAVGDTSGRLAYMPFYWSDYYGWDDRTVATNIGSSSQYYSNIFQRTTGSYKTGNSSPVPTNAKREVNYGSFTDLELYGVDYAGTSGAYAMSTIKSENYSTAEDRAMAYNGIAVLDNVWYVPFAPAPVVPFTETPPYYQEYGLPTPSSGAILSRADTLVWVNGMTWYDWDTGNCDNPYYVPMNSQIRNDVPSRCAGRPLLLANEPELSDQASMTNDEVARHAFYHRGWPGKLFSPAYNCIRPDGQNCLGYAFSQGVRSQTFNAHKTMYENVWGTLPYDGLATHQYVYRPTTVGSGSSYRSGLQQFKDLANSYGWEIWVTEFGWYPWDLQGLYYVDEQYIANNIDDLADAISAVLLQGRLMYFSHHACWETNPPNDRSCKRYPYQTPDNPDYNAWSITQMFAYDHTVCNGNPNCGAANWTCPDSNGDGKCDLAAPVGNAWKSYMDTH